MGKVITVWGSPGSGKSMFSCILAKALTRDKRKAIIINAEISVPMLPVWLPEQIIQTNASVGQVLSSVEIDTTLVASHVTVLKSYPFIGLMGYSAGENPLSYPETKYGMVLQLINAAAKLVDFVILDCGSNMTNVFTPAAIETGDLVIRILTPDLKGVNYLKAHQPLLVDGRFHYEQHMTFAGMARPFHALDEMGYIIGGFNGLLPYGKEIDRNRVTDIREISGNGVTAKVDGIDVAAGNSKLMDRLGVKWIDCHQSGTIIHMAVDGRYAGHIVISDIEKPHAKEAIQALKKAGVEKTVMLTGDSRRVAEHVAADLGIDEVHAELLPADKVSEVEEILKKNTGKGKLAFVGDGINDAPVLSRADIGIAMGAMGSDAAIEAADIVLMDDDPLKISKAIRISRKCLRIVYENIWFAIGIKLLCLVLGAVGIANMWLAIFADVGVMIIAVLNAIRALFVKKL